MNIFSWLLWFLRFFDKHEIIPGVWLNFIACSNSRQFCGALQYTAEFAVLESKSQAEPSFQYLLWAPTLLICGAQSHGLKRIAATTPSLVTSGLSWPHHMGHVASYLSSGCTLPLVVALSRYLVLLCGPLLVCSCLFCTRETCVSDQDWDNISLSWISISFVHLSLPLIVYIV